MITARFTLQRITQPFAILYQKNRLVFDFYSLIFPLLKLLPYKSKSSKPFKSFSRKNDIVDNISKIICCVLIMSFNNYAKAQWDSCYLYAYSADSSVLPLFPENFNFHGTSNPQVDSIFTHFRVIRYFQTNPSSKIYGIPHKYKILSHSVHSDSIIFALQHTRLYYKFEKIYVPDIKLLSNAPITAQQHDSNQLKIYPNPAFDFLTIATTHKNSLAEITISDFTGRTIQKIIPDTPDFAYFLNIDHYLNGVYIIQVKDINGKIWNGKFVKGTK